MGFFYGFDMTYLVFIVPCIIITLICQVKVKTTFSKYSQIRNSKPTLCVKQKPTIIKIQLRLEPSLATGRINERILLGR